MMIPMDEIPHPVVPPAAQLHPNPVQDRRYVIFQLAGWSFFFFRNFIGS